MVNKIKVIKIFMLCPIKLHTTNGNQTPFRNEKDGSQMLSNEQNPEECDARDDASSTGAGPINFYNYYKESTGPF